MIIITFKQFRTADRQRSDFGIYCHGASELELKCFVEEREVLTTGCFLLHKSIFIILTALRFRIKSYVILFTFCDA